MSWFFIVDQNCELVKHSPYKLFFSSHVQLDMNQELLYYISITISVVFYKERNNKCNKYIMLFSVFIY